MAYTKQNFSNGTVLTADQLNHIEDGIVNQEPSIGINGNWWIGNVDTGVAAQGPQGLPGDGGLPSINTEDNGKFLQVVDGAWAAVALTDVSEEGM